MGKFNFIPLLLPLLGTFILANADFPSSSSSLPNPESNTNAYRHEEILDPEGKYKLEWLVDWETDRIFFNVTVETRGWVGFGISKGANMAGTDLIIGGVDWLGRWYFSDRYAIGNQIPLVDVKQDWELHSAWESRTHTGLSFSRLFDTCDKEDIPIMDDTLIIQWAYGETDDMNDYHRRKRGSVPMYFRDPDLTPRFIKDGLIDDRDISDKLGGSDVKIWSLKSTFRIPAKRTTYWCTLRRITLPKKHHIIGFTFKINNQTEFNMHHLLLFRCVVPNPSSVFKQFEDHPGEECYGQSTMPSAGQIPFQSCLEINAGHAIGGRPIFLPDSMGIPLGSSTGQSEYYLYQTHYDNPELRSDLVSVNQLDIYYTPKLRPNDGGIMSVGHHIPGSPSFLIPPMSPDHRIFGHCSPSCTRKMFPPQGIKIVAALLHAHNTGLRVAIHHFRDNQELAPIFDDQNWQLNFQTVRLLRNEVSILPGDQLTIRCHFDTTSANGTIVGGWGSDKEMCKVFAFYYNLVEYPLCRSVITSREYTVGYLAGTTNTTWDQSRLELMATAPPHLAGMTLSQISDSRYVNWSVEQRARLQRDHIVHPQTDVCSSMQQIIAPGRNPLSSPTFASYPVEASEYQTSQRCSLG